MVAIAAIASVGNDTRPRAADRRSRPGRLHAVRAGYRRQGGRSTCHLGTGAGLAARGRRRSAVGPSVPQSRRCAPMAGKARHPRADGRAAGQRRDAATGLSRGQALVATLRGINFNPGAEPEDMVAAQVWSDGERVVTLRRRRLQSPRDVLARIDAGVGPTDAGRIITELVEALPPAETRSKGNCRPRSKSNFRRRASMFAVMTGAA